MSAPADRSRLIRTPEATTHGRYLVSPPAHGGPAPLLVGFHGYGEHAGTWLERALCIPAAERWLVVSVQGLHRFYNTKTEETVASWMTREDRDLLIEDNIAYVRAVVDEVTRAYATRLPLLYAGFSQGVAMAYRAAAFVGRPCRGVIALAGDLPPDVRDAPALDLPSALIGCGTRDGWYRVEALEADAAHLRARGVDVEAVVFDGGHEWGQPFVAAADATLARLGS